MLNLYPLTETAFSIENFDIYQYLAGHEDSLENKYFNPEQQRPDVKIFEKSIIRIDESYMEEIKEEDTKIFEMNLAKHVSIDENLEEVVKEVFCMDSVIG